MNENLEIVRYLRSRLMKIDGPLVIPTEAEISEIENRIGGLPSSYRAYIKEFGCGMLLDYVVVSCPGLNFEENMTLSREALTEMKEVIEGLRGLSFFPDQDGLVTYATTIDSHWILWERKGDPDEWSTVIVDSNYGISTFDGGFDAFLFSLLNSPNAISDFPCELSKNLWFSPLGAPR